MLPLRVFDEPNGLGNLPAPPALLRQRLQDDPFDIVEVHGAGGGVMGAKKLTLAFRSDDWRVCVKWKQAPRGGDGWNNSPRREIGVYAVQRLFLDPADYIVPPVVARCIHVDDYRPVYDNPTANMPGTRGVYGALAAWLDNVTTPHHAFDRERLASDARYAYHFGMVNLLAYLTDHRDARDSNFAISQHPAQPRIFSIDNGIAFGGVLYNFFTWHFNAIRVRAVPAPAIERLRRVTPRDLEALGVLAQMRIDASGILRPVAAMPNVAPDLGQRRTPDGIQFGLTRREIAAIARRLRRLLARVDRGRLATVTVPSA